MQLPISLNFKHSKQSEKSNADRYKGKISKKGRRYGNWSNNWKSGVADAHCVPSIGIAIINILLMIVFKMDPAISRNVSKR